MKAYILSFVLLYSSPSFSQCLKPPHGTLLFATICRDSILMAADSRASFEKDSLNIKTYYAHTDSVRKIFPLGYFQVMITGNTSYKDQFVENVILSFNEKLNPDSSMQKTFEKYKKYVTNKLKITDSVFDSVAYILAGYEKGIPKLLLSNFDKGVKMSSNILYTLISEPDAEKYYKRIDSLCKYQLPMINNLYNSYAKENVSIGGPLNIIQITKDNKINELRTFKFTKSYKSVTEYYKAILRCEVPVVYHYKWSEQWLKTAAKCAVKCKCD